MNKKIVFLFLLLINLLPAVHNGEWTIETGFKVFGQQYAGESDKPPGSNFTIDPRTPQTPPTTPSENPTVDPLAVPITGINVSSPTINTAGLSGLANSITNSGGTAVTATISPSISPSGGFSGYSWDLSDLQGNTVGSGYEAFTDGVPNEAETISLNSIISNSTQESNNNEGSGSLNEIPATPAQMRRMELGYAFALLIRMGVSMPHCEYDENYTGKGYAKFAGSIILVAPKFFSNLTTIGDQMACLYHEYTHSLNNSRGINPIAKDDNGKIIQIKTTETRFYTQEEKDYYTQHCKKDPYIKTEQQLNICIGWYISGSYTYICSNYVRDEIAALKAQLQGEIDHKYQLSDLNREEIIRNLKMYEFDLERSIKYEQNPDHPRNEDGSEKK